MRMYFKQRLFSWFDSYDIYDEAGNTLYTVKGQLSWGHCLKIFDSAGREVGLVKERVFTWLPKFELYSGGRYLGCVAREWSWFKPRYTVDCNGWRMEGDFFGLSGGIRRRAAGGDHLQGAVPLDGYLCAGCGLRPRCPAGADAGIGD